MSGSKQTTSNTIDPKLMALYNQNYQSASNLANTPYTPYSGQGVAPLTPQQQQAEGILGGVATNPQFGQTLGDATNSVNSILGNIQGINTTPSTASLQPFMNPYQQDVINSTMAQLGQQQSQALTAGHENATLDKAFGGNRVGVQDALTNQQYGLLDANTLAQLNSSDYSQALQAFENANQQNMEQGSLGLTGENDLANLGMAGFDLASKQGGLLDQVGAEQQQQQQNVNDWNYQQFLNKLNWPFLMQDVKNQALGMIPLQQTQTTKQSGGALGGILGGLGDAAMMAGLFI